jgi:hypothetical protein
MTRIIVHENVPVSAVYIDGICTLKAFIINGKQITVDTVLRRWKGSLGARKYQYYQVRAEDREYILCFDVVACEWMVKEDGPQ